MAVKITSESGIKKISPENCKFDIDEFDKHVNGWAEPFEIGNAWVVFSERKKNASVNQIATLMFGFPMYGDVLVVPPQQMPKEWDIKKTFDFSVEDFDNSFLYSIEETLNFVRQFEDVKEEWIYTPGAVEPNEDTTLLFLSAYEYLVNTDFSFLKENILYEDEMIILISKSEKDTIHFLNQLLNYFVELEEYERCAIIKKKIDEIYNDI